MVALKSLEPIKNAIGSQDETILRALHSAVGDDEDFQEYASDMIMSPRPASEPGCWNYLVEPLAKHLKLSPKRLPLNDWKQYYVWEEYRANANPMVSPESQKLLELMELGRPFQGSEVDHDGCCFAWLSPDESKSLLRELSEISTEKFGELDEFHEELVKSLQITVKKKCALFLGAH